MPETVTPLKLPLHVELPDGETCELVDAEGMAVATDSECAENNLLSVQESKSLFEQLAHMANRHPDLIAELGAVKAELDLHRALFVAARGFHEAEKAGRDVVVLQSWREKYDAAYAALEATNG